MIQEATYLQSLLDKIPHGEPFRFIDGLRGISDTSAIGYYTFPESADFYKGHFPGYPVTPGVILTECMVQCSVLPLAIHLLPSSADNKDNILPLLTHTDIEFRQEVKPGQKVEVEANLIYFRRGIIKCSCEMRSETGDVLSLGNLSAVAKQ